MASREFILHRTWARQATIGFLGATTPSIWSAFVAAFEKRLRELDWINGSNIAIDYRCARPISWTRFCVGYSWLIFQSSCRRGTNSLLTRTPRPRLASPYQGESVVARR